MKSLLMILLEKTYYVSPYDSQRSHPSMDLGVKSLDCKTRSLWF